MTISQKKAINTLKKLASAYCNKCLSNNNDARCGFCNINGLGNALMHNVQHKCSIKESVEHAFHIISTHVAKANRYHDRRYGFQGRFNCDEECTDIE